MESWNDLELESTGRITEPLKYDAASDRYLPVSWSEAFDDIAAQLRAMDPKKVVFYASGRASLETSYMYQLMARMYGTNNLPDSSNMCHESTSVALPETIGVPVGQAGRLNRHRLHPLLRPQYRHQCTAHAASAGRCPQRGVPVITFNPLRERGLERFVNPQSPKEMITLAHTDISSQYVQIKIGGDTAAAIGMAKRILERDDRARPKACRACWTRPSLMNTRAVSRSSQPPRALQSGRDRAARRRAAQRAGTGRRHLCRRQPRHAHVWHGHHPAP
jgi:anaerobic selenocysteine-containing dehydrogenase